MSDFADRARAEAERIWPPHHPSERIEWRDRRIGFELGALWAAQAWPVLSAGLRELADEWVKRNPDEWHRFGAQRGIEASREAHARELLQELDRIDQELGIEADHQPGTERAVPCPAHRPVQHRDARPPWCNTCGLTEGGEVPTGPLDRGNRS